MISANEFIVDLCNGTKAEGYSFSWVLGTEFTTGTQGLTFYYKDDDKKHIELQYSTASNNLCKSFGEFLLKINEAYEN